MTNLKDIEKVGRQAWLATIGTYAKGWDIISGKASSTFDDANKFVNDMIENGEKIETDLKEKVKSNILLDEKISALKVKLGVDTSVDEKIAELNKKVDLLADEINKLVDARLAALKANQPETAQVNKVTAKKTVTKTASKAPAKAIAKKAPAKVEKPADSTKPTATRTRKTAAKTEKS